MRLYLDDARSFPAGWDGCRCTETAKELLSLNSYDLISLDYDLGYDRETGLDLLYWMKENDIFVPRINIHSTHPYGRKLMWDFVKTNFPASELTAICSPMR